MASRTFFRMSFTFCAFSLCKNREIYVAQTTMVVFILTNIRRLYEHFKRFRVFLEIYSLFKPPPTITSPLEFPTCLIYLYPKSLGDLNIWKARAKPADFVFLLKFLFFNMKYSSKHLLYKSSFTLSNIWKFEICALKAEFRKSLI